MKTLIRALLLASLGLLPSLVYAEDIDIYMDPEPPLGGEPLVMFSIDYRPNLGSSVGDQSAFFEPLLGAEDPDIPESDWTFFDIIRLSLKVVFKDITGVKVGLMMNHDNSNNCEGPEGHSDECSNGSYILMGFESLESGDTNGAKAKFNTILNGIPVPQGNLAHSWQGKEMFFEFFRYLTGGEVYNGRNGWTDFNTDDGENLPDDTPGATWDASIMQFDRTVGSGNNAYDVYEYISPLVDGTQCTRIFSINLMFSVSNQDSDSDDAITETTANGGMGGINLQGSSNDVSTVIKYLYDADLGNGTYGTVSDIDGQQNVVSYFVMTDNNFQPNGYRYATAGGTGLPIELASQPQELIDTLTDIFNQILSVSTTFVAASVPVNVFNRSEIVDNVYIALFQADPDAKPAWPGSLKKLKIEQVGTVVRLVDVNGADAVAADGRINFGALTFWTDGDALPDPDLTNNEIEGRDGRAVDRGGAGQKIPGFISGGPGATNATLGARQLFTEPASFSNGTATDLLPLDADADTAAALLADIGSADADEALAMLKWMRGLDIDNVSGRDPADPTLARPWLLGDPLHSRPLPINYGARDGHSNENPDIRILIGSNDGYLRLIRNTAADGEELGREVWGFMPRTVMDKMATLRTNTPLPSEQAPHPYTVDGAPVVYTRDLNGNGTIDAGDTVIAFVGLRRGGRAYYALDISDPDDPHLLWRVTAGDDGFGMLGLSYATPQVGTMQLDVDGSLVPTPVLVFSGGYDPNKDLRGVAPSDDTQGNTVIVVKALTGELVWAAAHDDMDDSIPSDPTVVDTSGDGYIDRIYVGDSGGTVWRIDTVGDPDEDWLVYPLAKLGRHYDDTTTRHDRRFFHAPDVVLSRDESGAFDAVVIGSGDRENPLDRGYTTVPENFVYMIKDYRTVSGPLGEEETLTTYTHDSFGDVTDNCLQADTCGEDPPDLTNGWRLQLEETAGEKSLALPFTIGGTVFFTTYQPPGTAEAATCGPSEGGGVLYAVALADARSTLNFDTTDDDPDNPGEATSRADRTRTLRSGGIPAEVVSLPPNRILLPDLSTEAIPGSMRWRTFWYEGEQP